MKHNGLRAPDVSRETDERLAIYARLLARWNPTINLVSRKTEVDTWSRHFDDSLQLAPFLPDSADSAVDLGSGAGFPGLVLSIATGLPFVLIEADHRKAAFLREVVSATGAPAEVMSARIEAAAVSPKDVVTARALAPLADLMRYTERFLKPSGVALFLKGAQAQREISEARRNWHMTVQLHQSVTDASGLLLEITALSRAAA